MQLTILEKGNYQVFLGKDYKNTKCQFQCRLIGGFWGFKSPWTSNRAEIVDDNKVRHAFITFQLRLFKKHFLKIDLYNNSESEVITIEPVFGKKLSNINFKFALNNNKYEFMALKGNMRVLYENGQIVATFTKKRLSYFGRDVFRSYKYSINNFTFNF